MIIYLGIHTTCLQFRLISTKVKEDARSALAIKDEDTRFGTKLDGVDIKGSEKPLKNDEHVIQLGLDSNAFRYVLHGSHLCGGTEWNLESGGSQSFSPSHSRQRKQKVVKIHSLPFAAASKIWT